MHIEPLHIAFVVYFTRYDIQTKRKKEKRGKEKGKTTEFYVSIYSVDTGVLFTTAGVPIRDTRQWLQHTPTIIGNKSDQEPGLIRLCLRGTSHRIEVSIRFSMVFRLRDIVDRIVRKSTMVYYYACKLGLIYQSISIIITCILF